MAAYAVKIGEIHFCSETPITKEQRRDAIEHLKKYPAAMVMDNLVEIRPEKDDADDG